MMLFKSFRSYQYKMTHFRHGALQKGTRRYISSRVATKSTRFECPSCNKDVVFRAGTRRVPHFAHKANSACTFYGHEHTGPTESDVHKHAKLTLAEILKSSHEIEIFTFCEFASIRREHECHPCGTSRFKLAPNQRVVAEHRATDGCVYDVAVLNDADDSVACVFEIVHTHATETRRPEPWYEISAPAIEESSRRFRCVRTDRAVCEKCTAVIHESERLEELERDRVAGLEVRIQEAIRSCTGNDQCFRATSEMTLPGLRCDTCAAAKLERDTRAVRRVESSSNLSLRSRYDRLVENKRLSVRKYDSYRGPDPPDGLDGDWMVIPGECDQHVLRRFGVNLEIPDAKTNHSLRDMIKSKGARWCGDDETWYVPAEKYCDSPEDRVELVELYGYEQRKGAFFTLVTNSTGERISVEFKTECAPYEHHRRFLKNAISARWNPQERVWTFHPNKFEECLSYFEDTKCYNVSVQKRVHEDSGWVD